MTLHMLQLAPDCSAIIRWAAQNRLRHRATNDDLGYPIHALLTAGFGALSPKPWVLLQPANRPVKLLAYSAHDAAALREHAATFAEPAVSVALGLSDLAVKSMTTEFGPGRRLGFSLRARPTVRTDKAGDRSATRERDAFLAAIEGLPPGQVVERRAIYQAWLAAKFSAGGALCEQLRIESFARTTTLRRDKTRQLRPLEGPDVTFAGILRVTDPAAFAALLARGVGRHGAFGYGMILLKPA